MLRGCAHVYVRMRWLLSACNLSTVRAAPLPAQVDHSMTKACRSSHTNSPPATFISCVRAHRPCSPLQHGARSSTSGGGTYVGPMSVHDAKRLCHPQVQHIEGASILKDEVRGEAPGLQSGTSSLRRFGDAAAVPVALHMPMGAPAGPGAAGGLTAGLRRWARARFLARSFGPPKQPEGMGSAETRQHGILLALRHKRRPRRPHPLARPPAPQPHPPSLPLAAALRAAAGRAAGGAPASLARLRRRRRLGGRHALQQRRRAVR